MKQSLEEGEVLGYSWIQGEEIVADVFTKQGSRRDVLEGIIKKNKFKHAQTKDNLVVYAGDEFKICNLVTKKEKEQKE